jgi:hypothetical protein
VNVAARVGWGILWPDLSGRKLASTSSHQVEDGGWSLNKTFSISFSRARHLADISMRPGFPITPLLTLDSNHRNCLSSSNHTMFLTLSPSPLARNATRNLRAGPRWFPAAIPISDQPSKSSDCHSKRLTILLIIKLCTEWCQKIGS